jgi:hypothetical protein
MDLIILQLILHFSGGFRGALGVIAPLREKFFDFSQQKRTKNELTLPRMDPKKYFLLTTAPPFEKKCPPPSKILDPPLILSCTFFNHANQGEDYLFIHMKIKTIFIFIIYSIK